MKLLVLVPLLVACGGKPEGRPALAPAEAQQIRDLVRAAQKQADAYAQKRDGGLSLAWRNIEPGEAPCPVSMPKLPLYKGISEQTSEDRKALDVASRRMVVLAGDAMLGGPPPPDEKMIQRAQREVALKGPRRDQFERQSKMLLRIADEGKVPETFKTAADVIALATEIGSEPYWGWELVVLTSEHRAPMFNPEGFVGGAITGKALLWSFKDGRVVCAATVRATSQPEMKLELDPNNKDMRQHQVLNDDLDNQAYRAAIENLRAVP